MNEQITPVNTLATYIAGPVARTSAGEKELFGCRLEGIHPPQDFLPTGKRLDRDGWQIVWTGREDRPRINVVIARRDPGNFGGCSSVYSVRARNAASSPVLMGLLSHRDRETINRLLKSGFKKPDFQTGGQKPAIFFGNFAH